MPDESEGFYMKKKKKYKKKYKIVKVKMPMKPKKKKKSYYEPSYGYGGWAAASNVHLLKARPWWETS